VEGGRLLEALISYLALIAVAQPIRRRGREADWTMDAFNPCHPIERIVLLRFVLLRLVLLRLFPCDVSNKVKYVALSSTNYWDDVGHFDFKPPLCAHV
jgi:hypothetical protein